MILNRIHLICLLILSLTYFISSKPLELTDKTWKDMLCGQWMVEFYAPWCPSCQHFESVWNEFSDAMVAKEIQVASVDINQYPSLSGRFRISILPTIYYVRDGVFRQFNGERSLNGLKNYIEFQEWKRTEPVSPYFAPDSIPMSLVSGIFDISVLVKDAYTLLQDRYGWPSWLIYIVFTVIIIIVGLILGFGVLLLIDYCIAGSPKTDLSGIPDDSRDVEDLDENDLQHSPKTQKLTNPAPTLVASSTPQRPTTTRIRSSPVVEIQDEEALLNEVLSGGQDDNDSEGLNATDDDEQQTSSIRHRRTTNK